MPTLVIVAVILIALGLIGLIAVYNKGLYFLDAIDTDGDILILGIKLIPLLLIISGLVCILIAYSSK